MSAGRRGQSSLWHRLRTDERGAGYLAAFIVLFGVLGVLCTGILIDTGRMMATARQTDSIALEAARAAANAIDIGQVRDGANVVDTGAARAQASSAAAAFVSTAGAQLTGVSIDGNRVTVTVTATVQPWFPVMNSRTVTGTASADATVGVNES